MKTTIDIADNILQRSRAVAKREKTHLRSLVEEGLLMVVERHEQRPKFRAKPVTMKGEGLSAQFEGRPWADVRDAIYEGRGV